MSTYGEYIDGLHLLRRDALESGDWEEADALRGAIRQTREAQQRED